MYVDEHWYRPRGIRFVPERINLDFTSISTASLDVRLIIREDMRANIRSEPSGLGKYDVLEWAVVSGQVEYKTAS
jgi:hypothetical protein